MKGDGRHRGPAPAGLPDEGPVKDLRLAPGVVISNALCAYLEGPGAVIVSDLHLGMEAVAAADGAYFPRRQKPVIMNRLKLILDRFRPELFVIAGDFKHNFSANLGQEMDEVREVFEYLDSRTQAVLTKGNHDNYLRSLLPDVPLPDSARVGASFVCHGHRDLPALRRFKGLKIIGHEHPALKIRDAIGAPVSAPAFIFHEDSRTLVVPAISPLASGADVLRAGPRAPPLRRLDRRQFRLFAASEHGILDFCTVGRLESLMEPPDNGVC